MTQTIEADTLRSSGAGLAERLRRGGIRHPAVLRAIQRVPRNVFVAPELEEFAYEDTALPIDEGQTISQPFIVALMVEAADIGPSSRVLEIGTGSGYAAAVLALIAGEVYTIERLPDLARTAAGRLRDLGYDNVHVRQGDGTHGWPEAAPFDAILVAAGGPELPQALQEQLAPGGRLVIPIGETARDQRLVLLRRTDGKLERVDLGAVRFVPLVGGGKGNEGSPSTVDARGHSKAALLREVAEPFGDLDTADLGSLLERVGAARVVLIGEATHGTSEFYRMRARVTRELIARHGFDIVAIEGDWPDAARVHHWTSGREAREDGSPPFARFPRWMWRNRETSEFVDWLRDWNLRRSSEARVGFYGLDLYSMYASIELVLGYLDRVDRRAAAVARERYGCLTPWQRDPATYGRAAVMGRYRTCEDEAIAMLELLLSRRLDDLADGEKYLDAVQNARLVANAERYYRVMYRGGHEAWNLRDRHMFETLQSLLSWRDEGKAVVWAHNSHVGDHTATEPGAGGQETLGGYTRGWLGERAFSIGFGTDHGVVAAASDWDEPMELKALRPALPESYEALGHASGVPSFLLHLRDPSRKEVRDELEPARLERAIGVIYRPETELQSHYFYASLPNQFDEWIWFDETSAVTPLESRPAEDGVPETFPFGL